MKHQQFMSTSLCSSVGFELMEIIAFGFLKTFLAQHKIFLGIFTYLLRQQIRKFTC